MLCVINLEASKIQLFLWNLIRKFSKEVEKESGKKVSAKNEAMIAQNPKNTLIRQQKRMRVYGSMKRLGNTKKQKTYTKDNCK